MYVYVIVSTYLYVRYTHAVTTEAGGCWVPLDQELQVIVSHLVQCSAGAQELLTPCRALQLPL